MACEGAFTIGRLGPAGVARDAVITMVDASTFLRLSAEHDILADQVKAADFLVLNKIDLVTDQKRRKVKLGCTSITMALY